MGAEDPGGQGELTRDGEWQMGDTCISCECRQVHGGSQVPWQAPRGPVPPHQHQRQPLR